MYTALEGGTREGKGYIWDRLQDLFGADQKELRALHTKEAAISDGQAQNASAGVAAPAFDNIRPEVG
jgi:hypothetical protein